MLVFRRLGRSAILAMVMLQPSAVEASTSCLIDDPRLTEVRSTLADSTGERPSLDDLSWFVGDWVGEVFGLSVNHVVLAPVAGQLPGLVRLYNDDGLVLYELSSFFVEEGQLVYRNRLFDPALKVTPGPTGDMQTRAGIAKDEDIVFFDGITFAKGGDNCAIVSFVLPDNEGNPQKHSVFFERRERSLTE